MACDCISALDIEFEFDKYFTFALAPRYCIHVLSVNSGALAATFQYHVVKTQETCIYYLDERNGNIFIGHAKKTCFWLDIILDEFYESKLGHGFSRPQK